VEIHGFGSKDELLGKGALELVAPGDHERVAANMRKAIKQGITRGVEYTLLRADGSEFPGELSTSMLKDASGNPAGQITIIRDITERKQAEEALKLQQAYFQQLFDNSPDAIGLLDTTDRFVNVNKGFETLFGYRAEEIKGRFINELVIPEDRMEEASALSQAALNNKARRKDTVRKRKDGSLVDVDAFGYPIQFGNKTVGVYAVYTDITERKQAEETLLESEERFRSIVENSHAGIMILDDAYRFIYVNPQLCRISGYPPNELIGQDFRKFLDEESKQLVADRYIRRQGGEEIPPRYEFNIVPKDGQKRRVEISSAVIKDSAGGVKTVAQILDITERKQAEEREKQLHQELYLSTRLASIGELAAGVAHEINNPLTGVLGFSQRLLRKSTSEEVSRGLEIIHSEAQRAAEVVQNLLTFARRRQPKKEYSNINDIVQKALELRAYVLQTSNIEVVTNLAPGLPEIMVDFPQIQEVFLNIILNAEQAMSETYGRGKLIIKTREVKDYVRISFADDGPGIPPEQLDKVFDPFFTTREEKGGTGLGLSACHGIVTEHGGRIYARSKPGKGATFFVELPLSLIETTLVRRA
jgi:PAS domain S-box-containing protein